MSYLIASNAHKLLHCIQSLLNVWIFIQISQSSSEDPTGKLFKSQPAFILKLLILCIRLKRIKNAVFSNSKTINLEIGPIKRKCLLQTAGILLPDLYARETNIQTLTELVMSLCQGISRFSVCPSQHGNRRVLGHPVLCPQPTHSHY